MTVFIAHYRSPDASRDRACGTFEFDSSSRLGSKANSHDARVRMLELFGADALAWSIVSVERKDSVKARETQDGQLEMDFRDPVGRSPKKRRASIKRGIF